MGDRNHRAHEQALPVEDDITVVFHQVDSHGDNSGGDHDNDECSGDEERIHLQGNRRQDAEEETRDSDGSREEGQKDKEEKTLLRQPAFCVGCEPASSRDEGTEKPKGCPGLGLFYAFLSTVFFSIITVLVKTIQGVHAIEISAIRCFFQMIFVMPLLIYHKMGFLGPRDKRTYMVLRGLIGSSAMMLLYYAVQQIPLGDVTVIIVSSPVFTSFLAWIFLKEKCTIWDCVFTVFTIIGVILIAQPPFVFGDHLHGIEGNYSNHIKGTIAAFAGAVAVAFAFVVLRKMGKSVHYYLSIWYYSIIGFIMCIITVSVLGEWKIPSCGRDRWMLMMIAVLGTVGQSFLTKALQIEKAGPVALVRTVGVVLAFIFQFIFFNHVPTLWSLGGALCVVMSTSGIAVRKWYSSSRKN